LGRNVIEYEHSYMQARHTTCRYLYSLYTHFISQGKVRSLACYVSVM